MNDTHILKGKTGDDADPATWRRALADHTSLAPDAVARMPLALVVWLVEELRRWAAKKSNAEDYKRFLRHYGGGGMECPPSPSAGRRCTRPRRSL